MAMSTCGKCGGHMFEVVENSPHGANYKVMFVQCMTCGVPVGTQDYYNVPTLIQKQTAQITNLASSLDDIERKVRNIEDEVRRK